jgi:hypothetical protein
MLDSIPNYPSNSARTASSIRMALQVMRLTIQRTKLMKPVLSGTPYIFIYVFTIVTFYVKHAVYLFMYLQSSGFKSNIFHIYLQSYLCIYNRLVYFKINFRF